MNDAYQRAHLQRLLSPIASLLAAADVGEIMINGPERIYAERAGRIERTGCVFDGEHDLTAALLGIAQWAGHRLDAEHPVLEARLPDGSRVEAVIPPASPAGPVASIRRFTRARCDPSTLVASGALRQAGAKLLEQLVRARRNLLVAGGTGSGKTTLLNMLSRYIPESQRVIVIEDTRELELGREQVVHLEARPPDARGRGAVSVGQLFRASLRLRPDRIVVGEVRGPEALDMIQAMTSGHGGCLATVHATSPADALRRLETLCLMSDVALPLAAIRAQLASGIDVIVQAEREDDGRRIVRSIVEIRPHQGGYKLTRLYDADPEIKVSL